MTLDRAGRGYYRILDISQSEVQRSKLHSMGLLISKVISVKQPATNGMVLLAVDASRMGLSSSVAKSIVVEPICSRFSVACPKEEEGNAGKERHRRKNSKHRSGR